MDRGREAQGKSGCEVCGKEQDRYFEVHLGGEKHIFDSFECAMHGLMPRCGICGGVILGPGIMLENKMYCGQPCASISLGGEYGFSLLVEGQTSH